MRSSRFSTRFLCEWAVRLRSMDAHSVRRSPDEPELISPYLRSLREEVGSRLILMPSVAAAIFDAAGRILLVRYAESHDVWGLPGGGVDPHERPADAVVREVWEETRLLVNPIRVLGVYGGPEHHVTYANGDQVSCVSTVFECEVVRGEPRPDGGEIAEAGYFSDAELGDLRLSSIAQVVLPHAFARPTEAFFQQATWMPPR